MASSYLSFVVTFCQLLQIISATNFTCKVNELSSVKVNDTLIKSFTDGNLTFEFDRSNLLLHTYDDTQLANFLLPNVKIDYNVLSTSVNEPDEIVSYSLRTNIEGSTKLQQNNTIFTECSVDLKKFIEYSNQVPTAVQEKTLDLADTCISSKLCAALNHTLPDDYSRAKNKEYDYKENSALYKSLNEKYPLINLPDPKNKSANGPQTTLNILADFWFANVANKLGNKEDGRISVPDILESIPGIPYITQGFFNVYSGFFGNIRDFSRDEDIKIKNVGLEFSIETSYVMSNTTIKFDKYQLKRGFVNSEGALNINMKDLKFKIEVALNYNKKPCEPRALVTLTQKGKRTFVLGNQNLFNGVIIDYAASMIGKFVDSTVEFVLSKINEAIREQLINLNCEKYRP